MVLRPIQTDQGWRWGWVFLPTPPPPSPPPPPRRETGDPCKDYDLTPLEEIALTKGPDDEPVPSKNFWNFWRRCSDGNYILEVGHRRGLDRLS